MNKGQCEDDPIEDIGKDTNPPATGAAVIETYLKSLPGKPGVYRMLNADGELEDVLIRLPDGPNGALIANGDESSPAIWAGTRADGMYRILLIDTEAPITYDDTTAAAGGVSLPLSPDLEVRLTALILPEWNDEIMATLKEEISR